MQTELPIGMIFTAVAPAAQDYAIRNSKNRAAVGLKTLGKVACGAFR